MLISLVYIVQELLMNFLKKIISSICFLLISHAFRLLEQMLLKTGKKSFAGLYEQLALLVEGIFVGKQ